MAGAPWCRSAIFSLFTSGYAGIHVWHTHTHTVIFAHACLCRNSSCSHQCGSLRVWGCVRKWVRWTEFPRVTWVLGSCLLLLEHCFTSSVLSRPIRPWGRHLLVIILIRSDVATTPVDSAVETRVSRNTLTMFISAKACTQAFAKMLTNVLLHRDTMHMRSENFLLPAAVLPVEACLKALQLVCKTLYVFNIYLYL